MTTATDKMPHPLLVAAVAALTGRDSDYAREQNGIGWAASDSHHGHALAEIPAGEWSEKATYWAYQSTRKYLGQLASVGIDWHAIPPVRLQQDAGSWHREMKEQQEEGRRRWEREIDAEIRVFDDYERQQAQKRRDAERQRQSIAGRAIDFLPGRTSVVVRYPFDYALKDVVKAAVAGIKFDAAKKHWWCSLTKLTVPGLETLVRQHGFRYGEGVAERIADLGKEARELEIASRAEVADFAIDGLLREPYPFQRAGIAYAVRAKRTFIADAPGLGKTIQAIATIRHLNLLPCVVVCPTNVVYNWRREIEATLPNTRVCIVEGTRPPAQYDKADWYIFGYAVASAHCAVIKELVEPESCIFDEGHYLANPATARTKACALLADKLPARLILGGTAAVNKPLEILSQLKILGRLGDVAKNDWEFKNKFCGAYHNGFGWDFSGSSNETQLNQLLRASCYVRREKADVLKELPAKIRSVVEVRIDNMPEYERAERDVIRYIMDKAENDKRLNEEIAHLSRAEQIEARRRHAQAVGNRASGAEHLVKFNELKQIVSRGKAREIVAWVEDFLATGEKLVIFAWYRETVEMLCRELAKVHGGRVPHIMGGDSAEDRQKTVDRFQNDPACRLLVCNIIAAGEGITLTAASDVLFVELGWNPGKMEQAEDRCHRIGQKDSVTAWYLLGKGTIEADIYALIERKRRVVTAVNTGNTIDEGDIDIADELIARLKQRGY